MGLAEIKINIKKNERPTDPVEIFKSLTLRGSVEGIWDPQAEALREWYANKKDKNDVVIQMNTGGGKTLVGLLIAQSIVNQTKGHVLYVCANNQLVEQTIAKAEECGIEVASRYKSNWENKGSYDEGEVFCVTNYATLFQGFSIFKSKQLNGVIFDDAHVAENLLRDNFTLTIKQGTDCYTKLTSLFKDYFDSSSQKEFYEEILSGYWMRIAFLPTFYVWDKFDTIRKILIDSGVEDEKSTKYPWEHLKAHLRYCCIMVSSSSIQISPSITPLNTLTYFSSGTQRLYLTATMPSRASFIRAFGINNPEIVSPGGKSGDAQRLFVFLQEDDDQQLEKAKTIVNKHKSCVISPSSRRLKEWEPEVNIYTSSAGHEEIIRFSKSDKPEMLGLAARYDGVDLPGNSCRILILDRLPAGENHFNSFIDQSIQVGTLRSSHTATRITQAIGRIFRGNTDHGVVLLRGDDLQSWLRSPSNRKFLPELLQKQIKLGIELSKKVQDKELTYTELIDAILKGSKGWDNLYKQYIDEMSFGEFESELEWYETALVREKEAYQGLWAGKYEIAARTFTELAGDVQSKDINLNAWYCHWAGLAYLARNDKSTAIRYYWRAANNRADLGRPSEHITIDATTTEPGFQAINIARNLKADDYERKIHSIESNLIYGSNTNAAEEALKQLGALLGLEVSRPDNESRSGPDVLWIGENEIQLISFELKTDKENDEYSKNDIKDCNDHHSWLLTNHPGKKSIEILLGKYLKVANTANPLENLRLVDIEALTDLLGRLKLAMATFNDPQSIQDSLEAFGLLWPKCVDSLKNKLVIDIKNSQQN